MSAAGAKVCRGRCQRLLPLDAFPRQATTRDGRRARCRLCTAEDAADRRRRANSAEAFRQACGRVLQRRRARARAEADARLLAAVDAALERTASPSKRPSESADHSRILDLKRRE
jgi:hypothetical protein